MPTLDNIVVKVPAFAGDIAAQKRDYERATAGIEVISRYTAAVEETLQNATGFGLFRLPPKGEVKETTIDHAGVSFEVKSSTKIKKPAYKDAVTGFEQYLTGLSVYHYDGRSVTGLIVDNQALYISVNSLQVAYEGIVAAIMVPTINHKIKMTLEEAIANEQLPAELKLDEKNVKINGPTFLNYARASRMRTDLDVFVEAYDKALGSATAVGVASTSPKSSRSVTPVNSRAGFETTDIKAATPNYLFVVKSLVQVPTDRSEEEGELDLLADDDTPMAERQKEHPFYQFKVFSPRGAPTLYVGIESVYQRIQDLKTESTKNVGRQLRKHVEIV